VMNIHRGEDGKNQLFFARTHAQAADCQKLIDF
jgi:hypothetical protein